MAKAVFLRDIFLAGHQRHKGDQVDESELGVDEKKLALLKKERVIGSSSDGFTKKSVADPAPGAEEEKPKTKKKVSSKKKAASKDGE